MDKAAQLNSSRNEHVIQKVGQGVLYHCHLLKSLGSVICVSPRQIVDKVSYDKFSLEVHRYNFWGILEN